MALVTIKQKKNMLFYGQEVMCISIILVLSPGYLGWHVLI